MDRILVREMNSKIMQCYINMALYFVENFYFEMLYTWILYIGRGEGRLWWWLGVKALGFCITITYIK